mmetsp:Transcript_113319/g.252792  ORF Transcript_113319/g.252792 Transcript_113319/m.252792 type:complete len:83 (+) Transcript_113319:894-1142(+)
MTPSRGGSRVGFDLAFFTFDGDEGPPDPTAFIANMRGFVFRAVLDLERLDLITFRHVLLTLLPGDSSPLPLWTLRLLSGSRI